MQRLRVRFFGSDAFGSGGRVKTCFHVTAGDRCFLIDCGATALPAIKAAGLDRNAIDTIHPLPRRSFRRRTVLGAGRAVLRQAQRPVHQCRPQGLREWFVRSLETAYPGSSATRQRFSLTRIGGRETGLQGGPDGDTEGTR